MRRRDGIVRTGRLRNAPGPADNRRMLQSVQAVGESRASMWNTAPEVLVNECKSDSQRVAVPSASVHVVARLAAHVPGGFDIHAMGPRMRVHRKLIRGGQITILARLSLRMYQAILGRPASELAGRIVALRDLWEPDVAERLEARLAAATDARTAAAVLSAALSERLEVPRCPDTNIRLARTAARRLGSQSVTSVAKDLGVSERHLRRIFHEVVGLSPKAFFKLSRFERALAAGRHSVASAWTDIAAEAGYYDQAHLIKDFHSIAGSTPREFLEEVNGQSALIKLG